MRLWVVDKWGVALSWRARAACLGADPNLFFPEPNHHGLQAKAVCSTCPVRVECLEYAMAHKAYGVWGGTSERERRTLRRAM